MRSPTFLPSLFSVSVSTVFTLLHLLLLGVAEGAKAAGTGYHYQIYANEFVSPEYLLAKNFSDNTRGSQATIVEWADLLASEGPWSVTTKSVNPPSGDKHDYLSWAPYSWPNCTGIALKTDNPEEVWKTCPYYTRDGEFNPDRLLVNNTGHFAAMSDAIFFGAMAHVIKDDPSGSSVYSKNIALWIKTWFLDEATKMNPHLNYAQLARGPTGQYGQHTGVLDLHTFPKIATGVMVLRKGKSPDWTQEIDQGLNNWAIEYMKWLENSPLALGEKAATNNHGSFYFNQLAALKIMVGDLVGAKKVTDEFFSGIYLNQIDANGEQPLESIRTRPYHYRAYNLHAIITNARLSVYADPTSTAWNTTTKSGGTILKALDYTIGVSAAKTDELGAVEQMFPVTAGIAMRFGDPTGRYVAFLKKEDPTYGDAPYFLWDQPLPGESSVLAAGNGSSSGSNAHDGSGTAGGYNDARNSGAKLELLGGAGLLVIAAVSAIVMG